MGFPGDSPPAGGPFNPGGAIEVQVDNVPCDGTITRFTFPAPFTHHVGRIEIELLNYSNANSNASPTYRISGQPDLKGFAAMIGGGLAGETISVLFKAFGV